LRRGLSFPRIWLFGESKKRRFAKMEEVRKDFFEELNKVKDLIKTEYPKYDVRNLCDTLRILRAHIFLSLKPKQVQQAQLVKALAL